MARADADNWQDFVMKRFEQEEAAWKLHPGNAEMTGPPPEPSERDELLKQMAAIAKRLGL